MRHSLPPSSNPLSFEKNICLHKIANRLLTNKHSSPSLGEFVFFEYKVSCQMMLVVGNVFKCYQANNK